MLVIRQEYIWNYNQILWNFIWYILILITIQPITLIVLTGCINHSLMANRFEKISKFLFLVKIESRFTWLIIDKIDKKILNKLVCYMNYVIAVVIKERVHHTSKFWGKRSLNILFFAFTIPSGPFIRTYYVMQSYTHKI